MSRLQTLSFLLALLCAGSATAQTSKIVRECQRALDALPDQTARDCTYFFTTWPYAGEEERQIAMALSFAMASTSRQEIVERCRPVKVPTIDPEVNLYQFDRRDLLWDFPSFARVFRDNNPYHPDKSRMPTVIPALWFVTTGLDLTESDAYDTLFYGVGRVPTTVDEIERFFKVDKTRFSRYGAIEGKSKVNLHGTRWLESFAAPGGYYWRSLDSERLVQENDPLEHPDGRFKSDGTEIIASKRMVCLATGDRGFLNRYALANGQGKVVARAPVSLVHDTTHTRGQDEIRSGISCNSCHAVTALNPIDDNVFKRLVGTLDKPGFDPYILGAKSPDEAYALRDEVEAFHGGDPRPDMEYAEQGHSIIVRRLCGAPPSEVREALRFAHRAYDADLTLRQTADELYVDVRDWARVLSNNAGPLPGRLASLMVKDAAISRPAWEQVYAQALYGVHHGQIIRPPTIVQQPEAKPKKPPQARRSRK